MNRVVPGVRQFIITTPEGERVTIDDTKLCLTSSPEVCWEEEPEWVNLLISYASQHKGWRVDWNARS